MHLSKVYLKLGVANRTELAGTIGRNAGDRQPAGFQRSEF
jgi:hypothetical protein